MKQDKKSKTHQLNWRLCIPVVVMGLCFKIAWNLIDLAIMMLYRYFGFDVYHASASTSSGELADMISVLSVLISVALALFATVSFFNYQRIKTTLVTDEEFKEDVTKEVTATATQVVEELQDNVHKLEDKINHPEDDPSI